MAIKIAGQEVINDDKELVLAKLAEVNASIADTAVDVFVYDTRKDSDGGAWRKRTQHTSWYNETLNTATRGARKEFPAVAVIVAETNQVTIYDGDDPSLPMWMVFSARNTLLYPDGITSVVMQNGLMASGGDNTIYYGFVDINFISEETTLRTASTAYASTTNISGRNSAFPYVSQGTVGAIVNVYINDIAMTVLPNAPIDSATGLPVPTIAVATDGGVSVIKDDGSVVDITSTGVSTSVNVSFDDSDNVIFTMGDFPGVQVLAIPSSDYSIGAHATSNSPEWYIRSSLNTSWIGWDLLFLGGTNSNFNFAADSTGTSSGLTRIARNTTVPSEGMVSYITSSYNTGWMNGDIKLATLSDTDTTNVTGTELVTNGTFDTDTTGWSAEGATLSVVSNRLRVTNTAPYGEAYQGFTTVVGKKYTLTIECLSGTSAASYYLTNLAPDQYSGDLGYEASITGIRSITFVASATTTYIRLENYNATVGNYSEYDNISVRLAEEDRSVNGNGLQVFGTVTKSPVATGADLVAYSGFNTSNYLEAPRGSFTPISTDDFFMQCWVLHTGATGDLSFGAHNLDGNTTDRGLQVYINHAGQLYLVLIQGSTWVANVQLGTAGFSYGVWNHVGIARRNGVVYLYINGKYSNSVVFAGDAWDASGANIHSAVTSFKHALFRISGTAPTAEQIAKIYEDEKVLFQEGAQATLVGSSDAVTALAYDTDTELLHVGTSAGRSDFSGLRRVNNTTDAVGTAISASNGMIVEE